ncbi:hypothetical protein [Actomonas aquatica]|uniref:Uncharacterized protein n=1 Tax=Actomonas aquatica TaxID=2866162 RepID=A0ABZ1C7E1_9BACT|nr:hypothetical protein [Opitutus sp. WL0086]WRQ86439.1 hypothetical protein K1X11_016610 [Opitutus sp. WL0086]
MSRLRLKFITLIAAAALPFWVHSARESVVALSEAPLLALQHEKLPPPLHALQWSLDLSEAQELACRAMIEASAPELDELSDQALSARMAAQFSRDDDRAALRRDREAALAEVQLRHAQNLLERRLRAQLTDEQVAKLDRWQDRSRTLVGATLVASLN